MKIYKTTEIEVTGLGQKIKKLREASNKPLSTICALIPMSVTNWYRIESESQALPLDTLRDIERVLETDFNINID